MICLFGSFVYPCGYNNREGYILARNIFSSSSIFPRKFSPDSITIILRQCGCCKVVYYRNTYAFFIGGIDAKFIFGILRQIVTAFEQ